MKSGIARYDGPSNNIFEHTIIKYDVVGSGFGFECLVCEDVEKHDTEVYGIIGKDVWKTWWMDFEEDHNIVRMKRYAMDIV